MLILLQDNLIMVIRFMVLVGLAGCFTSVASRADDADPRAIADSAIKEIGGPDKILKIFRMKERLAVSSDPKATQSERTSVLQPPKHWWVGKKDRVTQEKEPAIFLVWAWTLAALSESESELAAIPAIKDGDRMLTGLKVSGTVDPPMELYFDQQSHQLVRIDWRSDIHRFSDWKEHDGVKYPARCEGYKKATGALWYFTDIVELERLKEVPADLTTTSDRPKN